MGEMRIQVIGRHVDVGDALRSRIQDELTKGVGKYFSRDSDAVVTVSKEGHNFAMEVTLHLASGFTVEANGSGGDAHVAFSNVLEKIEKRVRRYKRRLKDHHATQKSPLPAETALYNIIAADDSDNDAEPDESAEAADGAPIIVAETTAPVMTISVSTAVMQLEISEKPALLFRNAKNNRLNMVYRRADGNIGWMDPQESPDKAAVK
jgi:ribosomal subunit interface protein